MANLSYGMSPSHFGHLDYYGNSAAGMSISDQLKYLNSNMGVLRGINVPGGGGVYDLMMKDLKDEQVRQSNMAAQQAQADREIAALEKLKTKPVPVYNTQSMAIGNNQNAGGVRSNTAPTSKDKSSTKGTYSLNRRNMSLPLGSLIGLGIR